MNSYQPNNYANYQRNYYTFVNGLEGAKAYPVVANQSVMLMDQENPVCYMKSADQTGRPTLKCYKLVEISESELIKIPVDPNTEMLKSEIVSINKRLDELFDIMKPKDKEVKADA